MRLRLCPTPLMASVARDGTIVRPVPLMVPAVHVNAPPTVTLPAPVSVPESVRLLNVCAAAKLAVPVIVSAPVYVTALLNVTDAAIVAIDVGTNVLLTVMVPLTNDTVPVGVNVPAGKLCVAPDSSTVPAPISDEPAR